MKKLIVLIVGILLFIALHCYTEQKFSNDPHKGVIEQITEWADNTT